MCVFVWSEFFIKVFVPRDYRMSLLLLYKEQFRLPVVRILFGLTVKRSESCSIPLCYQEKVK